MARLDRSATEVGFEIHRDPVAAIDQPWLRFLYFWEIHCLGELTPDIDIRHDERCGGCRQLLSPLDYSVGLDEACSARCPVMIPTAAETIIPAEL
jgi:hypothetical protein